MILPVAFISVIFFISASLGSEESCYLTEEEEDQCASVCYPIVKPLLRYFEKSNERDAQLLKCRADYTELQKEGLKQYPELSKCHQDYSDLVKSHLVVLRQLKEGEVKYEKLRSKQQEKNREIKSLKDQIGNLNNTSELATLTSQFREDIDKLGKIVKNGGMNENNPTKSEVETGELPTTPLPNNTNQTTPKTETIDFPDHCPRSQDNIFVLREIQLSGSDPFEVVCMSHSKFGSGWLKVYNKLTHSPKFTRGYKDFERGYGDVGTDIFDEFFIGLSRLHHMTNGKPHEVLLDTFQGPSICDNFVVGDRFEGYNVKSIGNCTGNVRIIPKQGSKFSTFDRDEDGIPDRNLAKEGTFGWWFDRDMRPDDDPIVMYIRRTD